jgi:hypothetical protein
VQLGRVKNIGRRVALGSLAGVIAVGGVSTAYTAFAEGEAGADTVTRMTVGTPGPSPYTPVGGTDRTTGPEQAPGTGTAGHTAPCDPGRLAATLRAEPAKAQAWADAHGIGVQEIPGFLSGLTPTYLQSDTLTMNHSYEMGRDTSTPAVLQAGMGVLVDRYGVPVVKCNCGNPLTRPAKDISTKDATYTGPMWSGFSKEHITKIPAGHTGAGNGTGNGHGNGDGTTKKRPRTHQEYVAWCKGVRAPDPDVDCSSPPPAQGQTGSRPGPQQQGPQQQGPQQEGQTGPGAGVPQQPAEPVEPAEPGGMEQPDGAVQPQPELNPQGGMP